MAKTEALFGTGNNFSLKNRYWIKFVDTLALMWVHKVKDQENVYIFYDDEKTFQVRLYTEKWEEGLFRVVELLDSNLQTILKEKIVEAGFPGTYDWHPLNTLFDMVRQEDRVVRDISVVKTIADVLA